ncbi:hypothetical protein SAMN05421595_1236 [Austwickia chelonae]|nr:hypothetical protein SAMN05421595_1236 [Austwickia chelonae]
MTIFRPVSAKSSYERHSAPMNSLIKQDSLPPGRA